MAIMRVHTLVPILLCALVLSAAGGCVGHPPATAAEPAARSRGDVLTRDDWATGHWQSAYELVETLRPRWIRPHGPEDLQGNAVDVQVRLDDQLLGGPQSLRAVAVGDIVSIRFVDGVSAAARWGASHSNGALVVSTRE